jgi:glycosyltransferase involved in cell wall biosynthesis
VPISPHNGLNAAGDHPVREGSPAYVWLTAGGSRAALSTRNARYGLSRPPSGMRASPGAARLPAPTGPGATDEVPRRPLRIAMVAPLAESVPPSLYGGTERVIAVLTEELVRRGHAVTLFASGDSRTSAELVPCARQGLRLDPSVTDYLAYTMTQLGIVHRRAAEFDLVHNHLDYFAFPTARLSPTPTVTTTHGRLDLPEVRRVYADFEEQALVAISDDQRAYLPTAAWVATVSNAVDLANYRFRPDPGDYLVFLGRISPEKRPDRAIEIARDVGMRLVMAAKVDDVDRDYYEHAIAPVIRANPDLVEFVGEVDEAGKDALLGGAWAYLFPIDWPEPFGLTMAEAMATGTPVVAYRAGSVPEVVEHGVTGFVCETAAEMAAAVGRVGAIDRAACRARVEQLFSPAAMADGYERAYRSLLAGNREGWAEQRVPVAVAVRQKTAPQATRFPADLDRSLVVQGSGLHGDGTHPSG